MVEKSGGGDVRRVGVAAREREERLTRRQSHGVVSGVVRRRETRHESRGASPELREFLIGQVAFVRLGRLGVVVVGDVVGERRDDAARGEGADGVAREDADGGGNPLSDDGVGDEGE